MLPSINPVPDRKTRAIQSAFVGALYSSSILIVALVAAIGFVLILGAWASISSHGIGVVFVDDKWFPSIGQFGAAPMFVSSMVVALCAVLIVAPFGIGVAIFNHFYAHRVIATLVRRFLNVATAIPSVVFGLWGLVTIVPLIALLKPPGVSLLATVLVLALMVMPTLALLADLTIGQVPRAYVIAATALGATKEENIFLTLRFATRGLSSALAFSFCRAIGETMVVLMLSGNIVAWPIDPLAQIRVVAANIALEMPYATGEHRSILFLGSLVLIVFISIVTFFGVRLMDNKGAECVRS